MESNNKLKKYLSPIAFWALCFGCSVGWGAYVMPGMAFLPIAGPLGTVIGMALGTLITLIIGLNYSYMMKKTVKNENIREAFSAILTDIQMPVMDGYELSRHVRSLQGKRGEIPIIELTANAFSEDINAAKAAGMNAHIAKPFDPARMIAVITAVIKSNEVII